MSDFFYIIILENGEFLYPFGRDHFLSRRYVVTSSVRVYLNVTSLVKTIYEYSCIYSYHDMKLVYYHFSIVTFFLFIYELQFI